MTFIKYTKKLEQYAERVTEGAIDRLLSDLLIADSNHKKVYIAGNGGSASTSDHIANDWGFATRNGGRDLPVISLCSNTAILSMIGNDFDFKHIFSEQIVRMANAGDILVVVSASGNSKNLVEAVRTAKDVGCKTWGLLGFDGGVLSTLCDDCVLTPTEVGDYGGAEDLHLMINHYVVSRLKVALNDGCD